MVMLAHLGPFFMVHTGIYAVSGFFILSGYLMAMVIDTHYSRISDGRRKYILNRLLRVMPAYWVTLALSAVVVFYYPGQALAVHERMQWPDSFLEWVNNLTVVGLTGILGDRSMTNLVPPTWSLAVELVWWVMLPLLLASARRFWLWGMLAFAYTAGMVYVEAPLQFRYYAILAGALPFFLGAYVYREGQNRPPTRLWQGGLMIAITIGYYLGAPWLFDDVRYFGEEWSESDVLVAGLCIALLLNAATVHILGRMDTHSRLLVQIDKGLGHLAYPIFLLHILAGVVIVITLGMSCEGVRCHHDWSMFWTSFPVVNIIALMVWFMVERPLVGVRKKVRQ